MKPASLSDFIIAFLDLMEAEGKSLRYNIGRLGIGLGFIAVAMALLLAAIGVSLWGLYYFIASKIGVELAALTVSLLLLVISFLFLWLAKGRIE